MITQAKAEEDCLTLQSLSTPSMSFVRKIPKNFGKSSIVTFVIQVGASIKQVSLTITCRLLLTEAINILVVLVWNLNLTLYLWWSSEILRAIFNHLLQGMKDKDLKKFMRSLEIQIRCQRWSLMNGWIGINAIHSDLYLTKRRRTPALEMTHLFWREAWIWQAWTSQPTKATTLNKISNCSSIAQLVWIHPAMKARTDLCWGLDSERSSRHPTISAQKCLKGPCLGDRGLTHHHRFLLLTILASRSILSQLGMIIYPQTLDLKNHRGHLNIVRTLKFKMQHSQIITAELFIKNISSLIQIRETKTCQLRT